MGFPLLVQLESFRSYIEVELVQLASTLVIGMLAIMSLSVDFLELLDTFGFHTVGVYFVGLSASAVFGHNKAGINAVIT